jgi:hypothetical protein
VANKTKCIFGMGEYPKKTLIVPETGEFKDVFKIIKKKIMYRALR